MTNTKLNPASEKGPSWLTEPCPQWCVATHREEDMVDDRLHFASWQRFIALPTAAPVMVGEAQRLRMRELLVYIEQHVDQDDGPRVVITDSHSEEHERRLSLDEAIGVGVALFHGISIITDGKTSIRSLERVCTVQAE